LAKFAWLDYFNLAIIRAHCKERNGGKRRLENETGTAGQELGVAVVGFVKVFVGYK
jgi:hypothetical protein